MILRSLFIFLLLLVADTRAQRRGFMLASNVTQPQITASHVDFLADRGATMVRLPLYFGGAHPNLTTWFPLIDSVLAVAINRNVRVVIDFHWPSPGHTNSKITNPADFTARWQAVAHRYRNFPTWLIWYDLCNEPSHPQWRQVAKNAALAIRAVDATHKIVFSPRGSAIGPVTLQQARPLQGISRQVVQMHFWDWIGQGDVQCPSCVTPRAYPSSGRRRANLRNKIEFLNLVRSTYNVPVYLGEIGVPRWHPNAHKFLQHATTICRNNNIHCTLHAFREATVWNYEANPAAWNVVLNWLAGS